MFGFYVFLGVVGMGMLLWGGFRWHRRRRRARLLQRGAEPSWESILKKRVRLFRRIPEELRRRLYGYMHVFLNEKRFEPCGGLETVSDEMRVTIAAQACVLLLNGRNGYFDRLRSVLVYPEAFSSKGVHYVGDGLYEEGEGRVLLGESWGTGSIVLSWESVVSGGANEEDGHNVVIHEFAHQLDQANGAADGAPILSNRRRYSAWSKALHAAYQRHVEDTVEGRKSAIDGYGATNPAEFFAVVTESFFERPKALYQQYTDVYIELKTFYEVDPIAWSDG